MSDQYVGMTALFGKVYAWVRRNGKLTLIPTWEKTDD